MWAEHSFGADSLVLFLIILARYFLAAGGCWWLLSACHPVATAAAPAQPGQRIRDGIRHDIRLSVLSSAIFALAAAAVLWLEAHGLTRLYAGVDPNPRWYQVVSYLMVLILQDALFYATHRLFHHSALYTVFHRGHHRSRRPTPWTSFAFDPPEALVQAIFLVAIVMLIPLHMITVLAVLSTMTVWAIVNHLDLDCLPHCFPHHLLSRWVIGPLHHSLHHRRPSLHFGLYFTFWDRVCGTEDDGYVRDLSAQSVETGVASMPGRPSDL